MKHVVCKCPHCGGEIVEFSRFYGCRNWKNMDGGCPFTLPKRFSGRLIPSQVVRELVSYRESQVLQGFESKAGNSFSASLLLVFFQGRWKLKMRFTR